MQKDAFERRKKDGSRYNREEWLREIFSNQFIFLHRSTKYFFVPESGEKIGLDERLIVGWIARGHPLAERTAPWEGLAPTEHQSWQAALIVIDPTHHEDGQKVAFEYRNQVGKTDALLASLAKFMTDVGADVPYSVTAYPIIQERSFARFAEAHRGEITTITYDVAVPNMFEGPDDFSKELRELRNKANISHVKAKLDSDGVINAEAGHLEEIATHVEKGGGKISARTNKGTRYNSDDHMEKVEVETDGVEPESESFWERIWNVLKEVML